MTRTAQQLLRDVLDRAEAIATIAAGADLSSPESRDLQLAAVLYHFVTLGEIAMRLGEPFRDEHPRIPWNTIIGHRNVIVHGYHIIDTTLLSETIEHRIPELIDSLKKLIQE